MARISYIDIETIDDPELRGYMEHSRQYGTPRPETQAIRFHVPRSRRASRAAGRRSSATGVVEHPLKELCRVYVSKSIDCDY